MLPSPPHECQHVLIQHGLCEITYFTDPLSCATLPAHQTADLLTLSRPVIRRTLVSVFWLFSLASRSKVKMQEDKNKTLWRTELQSIRVYSFNAIEHVCQPSAEYTDDVIYFPKYHICSRVHWKCIMGTLGEWCHTYKPLSVFQEPLSSTTGADVENLSPSQWSQFTPLWMFPYLAMQLNNRPYRNGSEHFQSIKSNHSGLSCTVSHQSHSLTKCSR